MSIGGPDVSGIYWGGAQCDRVQQSNELTQPQRGDMCITNVIKLILKPQRGDMCCIGLSTIYRENY